MYPTFLYLLNVKRQYKKPYPKRIRLSDDLSPYGDPQKNLYIFADNVQKSAKIQVYSRFMRVPMNTGRYVSVSTMQ